jgi:hypothetical protein
MRGLNLGSSGWGEGGRLRTPVPGLGAAEEEFLVQKGVEMDWAGLG